MVLKIAKIFNFEKRGIGDFVGRRKKGPKKAAVSDFQR